MIAMIQQALNTYLSLHTTEISDMAGDCSAQNMAQNSAKHYSTLTTISDQHLQPTAAIPHVTESMQNLLCRLDHGDFRSTGLAMASFFSEAMVRVEALKKAGTKGVYIYFASLSGGNRGILYGSASATRPA
jgi:hypothetical protein